MKLLYIVEDFSESGGVERIVSQKANMLSAQYGHDVTVVSVYRDSRPPQFILDDSVAFVRLDVPFAAKGKGRVATLASRVATLARAARRTNAVVGQIRPDIIFFTTTLGALLLPLCHTKATKVYESHLARKYTPFNTVFALTELTADTIVCLTKGDAADYRIARRVHVIPNFIELPARTVAAYSTKRAIAVGRLEHQKGFDILIDCWKEIVRTRPDWHLDIYGDGSCRQSLQRQIDHLHLSDKVTLCGRCNRIMERYHEYSLHIMPSRYEGQGIALIEAQACGLPSVAFDFVYGASDILKNGHNGILVDQGDNKGMIKAVLRMTESETLRREYGRNAALEAKKYDKTKIMRKWVELIDSTKRPTAPICKAP